MSERPETIIRTVVDECADCDICRFLMDDSCLMFPELYRLWDRELDTGKKISPEELRRLVDRCNFCALCPCPPVREKIMRAKAAFIDRDGLPPAVRIIEDVALLGRICGALPRLSNAVFRNGPIGRIAKRTFGIHRHRKLPAFPKSNFFRWAEAHGLTRPPPSSAERKVAYFAGCTAAYLFPEVAQAAVALLRACGAAVWVPPQRCCAMPTLLEGDGDLTLRFVRENVDILAAAAADGFDIVCSCPTCGFFLRTLLPEGAYFSDAYQEAVGRDDRYILAPAAAGGQKEADRPLQRYDRKIYGAILKDAGAFAVIDAKARIAVAENTHDLGVYLLRISTTANPLPDLEPVDGRTIYFSPCHQREQKIGSPYETLLSRIPGLQLQPLRGELYCCGMAGIMGFKKDFHDASLQLGQRLMDTVRELEPDRIVTDCLSCRLQFQQCLPHPVLHPVELLHGAVPSESRRASR